VSADRFTDELWSSVAEIYAAILAHPFIRGLGDGSLDRSAFRFYVVQDAHYLREYGRALALCAARSPGDAEILMFCRHAEGAVDFERTLHSGYLVEFGMTEEEMRRTPLAPTTLAYTSYLLSVAHGGSFPEALGAVLPCYWIYQRVGTELLAGASPDPLYRRWIESYGGEEFAEIVDDVLALTDRIAPGLGASEREAMRRHFVQTSRYEWMFWEMGYRQEPWPV
jgi:thiaminase (transcriptional activator TenA)